VACRVIGPLARALLGLAALTQDVLRQEADGRCGLRHSRRREIGLSFCILDGQGFCLYYKVWNAGAVLGLQLTEGDRPSDVRAALQNVVEGMTGRRPGLGARRAARWAIYRLKTLLFSMAAITLHCGSHVQSNVTQTSPMIAILKGG